RPYLRRDPLHPRDDRRVRAPEAGADLAVDQLGVGRHAPVPPARRGAGAGDDPGDVRTVPDVVARVRLGVGEVPGLQHLAGQVRVVGLDPGVQHADGDAGTGVPGLPRRRGADQRHADVQGRLGHAVQPYLGDAGGARPRRAAGEPVPELTRAPLVLPYRRAVDAR